MEFEMLEYPIGRLSRSISYAADFTIYLDTRDLKNLETLEFADDPEKIRIISASNNQLSHIIHIERFIYIRKLNLMHNNLKTLFGLESLEYLEQLYLSHNKITQFNCMENLTNLEVLYIAHNKLTSFEGAENLKNLIALDVSFNKLTSLNDIHHFKKLEYFAFNDNLIKNIVPLIYLSELEFVNLDDDMEVRYSDIIEFINDTPLCKFGQSYAVFNYWQMHIDLPKTIKVLVFEMLKKSYLPQIIYRVRVHDIIGRKYNV